MRVNIIRRFWGAINVLFNDAPTHGTSSRAAPMLLTAIMLFYRGTIPNANINITNHEYTSPTGSPQSSTNKFPENKSLVLLLLGLSVGVQGTAAASSALHRPTSHRSITTMCHIHFASAQPNQSDRQANLLGLHPIPKSIRNLIWTPRLPLIQSVSIQFHVVVCI